MFTVMYFNKIFKDNRGSRVVEPKSSAVLQKRWTPKDVSTLQVGYDSYIGFSIEHRQTVIDIQAI